MVYSLGTGIGILGTDIITEDALQVQLNPLRPFYKGEIVAWQSQTGEKLKYGRIPEDVSPSAGQALYKINIETSPGKTETVISSHVFWFKNHSMEEGDYAASKMCVEQMEGYRKAKLRNQRQQIKDLEHGHVSAEELIQAVEETLARAGIELDMEKQGLLLTALSLEQRLKESQAALQLEQEKSGIATKEADVAKAPFLCRICLSNIIDFTLVPCGHVLCHQCSFALSLCPFCRVQLSETIKMAMDYVAVIGGGKDGRSKKGNLDT
ncbi:sacsin isoform X1, partial [Tanacetum coccineum]